MSDETKQSHLMKRGSVYHFRARVPFDVQPAWGKKEEKFSLKTSELSTAHRLVREASERFEDKVKQLRALLFGIRQAALPVVLNDDAIREICELYLHCALDGDERTRQEGMSAEEFDELARERENTLSFLQDTLARGQLMRVEPALQQFLSLIGVRVAGDPESYRRLLHRFAQAILAAHRQQQQRDKGEAVWTPPAPSLIVLARAKNLVNSGPTMDTLIEEWRAAIPGRRTKTVRSFRAVANDFTLRIGKESAEAVTSEDAIGFCDALLEEGTHPNTVDKKLSYLKAVFRLAVRKKVIAENPLKNVTVPRAFSEGLGRQPYEVPDLNLILASAIYSQQYRPKGGAGSASVWIPLIGMFTGAGLEEIAQLRSEDVKDEDGIAYLHVRDIAEGTKLKNAASRRRVPIHPELERAGFLHYVEQIRGQGSEWLFPALKPDRDGVRSANWSKWWGRYVRGKRVGITDSTKVFHSMRHGFKDACEEAELPDKVARALMGHKIYDVHDQYGRLGRRPPLKRLYKAICKIRYPGLVVPVLIGKLH